MSTRKLALRPACCASRADTPGFQIGDVILADRTIDDGMVVVHGACIEHAATCGGTKTPWSGRCAQIAAQVDGFSAPAFSERRDWNQAWFRCRFRLGSAAVPTGLVSRK